MSGRRLENAEAYELYLKSRPLSNFNAEQNRQALALLQKAVSLDAKFALAHAAIARRYYWVGTVTGRADFDRSLEAARLALSLDPQLARAHHALAIALVALGRLDEARLAMQRAIELDGNAFATIADLSLLENNAGRLDQGVYWAIARYSARTQSCVRLLSPRHPAVGARRCGGSETPRRRRQEIPCDRSWRWRASSDDAIHHRAAARAPRRGARASPRHDCRGSRTIRKPSR